MEHPRLERPGVHLRLEAPVLALALAMASARLVAEVQVSGMASAPAVATVSEVRVPVSVQELALPTPSNHTVSLPSHQTSRRGYTKSSHSAQTSPRLLTSGYIRDSLARLAPVRSCV